MTPLRLAATLLEADDMLPQEGDFEIPDVKAYVGGVVDNNPLAMDGIPIRGFYQELARRFEGRRLKRDGPVEFFKIENNTFLERDSRDNSITVKLYYTDIIKVTPDGTVIVDNGGHQTVTTLRRLNDYLPTGWRIYLQGETWYWHLYGHQDEEANPGWKRIQPYSNGDQITADGTLIPLAGPEFKKIRKPKRTAPREIQFPVRPGDDDAPI